MKSGVIAEARFTCLSTSTQVSTCLAPPSARSALAKANVLPEVEDVVDDDDVAPFDVAFHVAQNPHLASRNPFPVIACEVDEIDLRLEPVAVQRPDEIGGEDEASLEHGDHHEVIEPSCGNVAGKLIDAKSDRLVAVERLDRAVRKAARGRHLGLAKRNLEAAYVFRCSGNLQREGGLGAGGEREHAGRGLRQLLAGIVLQSHHHSRHADLACRGIDDVAIDLQHALASCVAPRRANVLDFEPNVHRLAHHGVKLGGPWQHRHHGLRRERNEGGEHGEQEREHAPADGDGRRQLPLAAFGDGHVGGQSGIRIDQSSGVVAAEIVSFSARARICPHAGGQSGTVTAHIGLHLVVGAEQRAGWLRRWGWPVVRMHAVGRLRRKTLLTGKAAHGVAQAGRTWTRLSRSGTRRRCRTGFRSATRRHRCRRRRPWLDRGRRRR